MTLGKECMVVARVVSMGRTANLEDSKYLLPTM